MLVSHVYLLYLISTLISVSVSADASFKEIDTRRGNAFVDRLLQDMLVEKAHEYDPYFMEDSTAGFSKKVLFVNVSGEAKLFNGRITGLRTLHRVEDCSLTEDGDRVQVRAVLGVGLLNLHYDGTVRFMNWGPTIQVHSQIHYMEVLMDFSVDKRDGKRGVLHKFVIDDLRNMDVWVTGLGPLNWLVNPILKGVTKIFRGKLGNLLETKVERYIGERLPNFPFPV